MKKIAIELNRIAKSLDEKQPKEVVKEIKRKIPETYNEEFFISGDHEIDIIMYDDEYGFDYNESSISVKNGRALMSEYGMPDLLKKIKIFSKDYPNWTFTIYYYFRDRRFVKRNNVKLKQTGIRVRLVGEDGNAFAILGRVVQALRRARYDKEFIDAFLKEAKSGDYDHLLATVMSVVDVY